MSGLTRTIGVLVMSYGTPDNMEGVLPFYTHIRRGRPPEPEQLQELCDRYEAIGGLFPLKENTNHQLIALEQALNEKLAQFRLRDSVDEFVCFHGMKHVYPFVEDGVEAITRSGITQAVGIVLAPHFSTMSVGGYIRRAKETAAQFGLELDCIESYHLHPRLIEAFTKRIEWALAQFAAEDRQQVRVIYTAHSLPEKILEVNDPYPNQLLETARAISEATGVANWQFAWQSAGQTATPWLGPDIQDVLRVIHQDEHVQNVVICPIGFVSDHLEVLFDIDIEAKAVTDELGMRMVRPPSLNTDPLYIEALADSIFETLLAKASL